MPTVLFLFGLRFFFYSEEHLPIHIHVKMETEELRLMLKTLKSLKTVVLSLGI